MSSSEEEQEHSSGEESSGEYSEGEEAGRGARAAKPTGDGLTGKQRLAAHKEEMRSARAANKQVHREPHRQQAAAASYFSPHCPPSCTVSAALCDTRPRPAGRRR